MAKVESIIPKGDTEFLKKALKHLNIDAVLLDWSDSTDQYPDIWICLDRTPPIICVTAEWRRQKTDSRRSRLVHELLHILGLEHGIIDGLSYSTFPEFDTYSKMIYDKIKRGIARKQLSKAKKRAAGYFATLF